MSAVNAPFGFLPVFHPSGLVRAQGFKSAIPTGYASNIFKGQPVAIDGSNGNIIPVAANNVDFIGVFAGITFLDAQSRPIYFPAWLASQVITQPQETVVWVYTDPQIVYSAQADGSVARTALGREVNISNFAAGSTLTGLSQATLAATPVTAGQQGQWFVHDVSRRPDNDWGDAFTVLQVRMARSQQVANKVGI